MTPKHAIQQGVTSHKNPLPFCRIKGRSQLLWHMNRTFMPCKNPDFYGIWTVFIGEGGGLQYIDSGGSLRLSQLGAPRCGSGPNWCLEGPPPIPQCNWRTLPSSQSPSLPSLSLPLPPTALGSFRNAPGRGGPVWCGGRGPRVQGGGGGGGGLQRDLGPDPHLGSLRLSQPPP